MTTTVDTDIEAITAVMSYLQNANNRYRAAMRLFPNGDQVAKRKWAAMDPFKFWMKLNINDCERLVGYAREAMGY